MFATTTPFELMRPAWLAGLLVLPLLLWYFRRSLVDLARLQRVLSLLSRTAIVLLLVLALAGLTQVAPTQQQFVVFAIDRSQSISEEARRNQDAFIRKALTNQGTHRVLFVEFAASAGTPGEDPPAEDKVTRRPGDKVTSPPAHLVTPSSPWDWALATDLSSALEAAAGALRPGFVPHIVLLSDGNETVRDAVRTAQRLGIRISTVPLAPSDEPEVQVSEVLVPPQVREGEPFPIKIVVHSNHDDEARLELYRNQSKVNIGEERRKLVKGENTFLFQDALSHERLAVFRARVTPEQDKNEDNNSAHGLVYCAGKPRVLLVDSDPKQAAHLADALIEQNIEVDPPRPPEGLPETLAELQNYELVILSNVPAHKLTQKQMRLLRTYVQDLGGGFLMVGGEHSFGLGGYTRTVLEDVLPVYTDLKKEKEKPSLAMMLVLDKSGSMNDADKIALAREAAKNAVELLGPNDKVGVLAFDSENHWISEIVPCTDKGHVLERIDTIQADGGTRIYPAMDDAHKALLQVNAKLKHVILLTDGIDDSAGQDEFLELAGQMLSNRITVTTVAVGNDANNNLLEEIARAGQGRFYHTTDPSSVPQIFAKETITASKEAIQEQSFRPFPFRSTPVLKGIDWEQSPLLHGYVVTRIKETSEQILMTNKGDPLLSWMRSGLGMSVAFTSDAKSKWSADWITNWPGGYSRFWAQIARHAMRKNEAKGIEVNVTQQGQRVQVAIDVLDPDGRYVNDATAELTVIDERLRDQQTLSMMQTAPGRYHAAFDVQPSTDYQLHLALKRQDEVLFQQTRGLAVGYPEELKMRPTNEALLRSLAKLTGGDYQPDPEGLFGHPELSAPRATPLWPSLLIIVAMLLVIDVGLRRIDFSVLRFFGRRKLFSLQTRPVSNRVKHVSSPLK